MKPSFEIEPVAMAAAPDEDEAATLAVLDPDGEVVEVPVVVVLFFVLVDEEDEPCESAAEVIVEEEDSE
jgi:hypothetical protein